MRASTIGALVLALGLAGATIYMMSRIVFPSAAPAAPEPTQILVAAEQLPAGTIVKSSQWRWQAWPDGSLHADYIVKPKTADKIQSAESQVTGAAVRSVIGAGEPITLKKVLRPGDAGFLAGALRDGMRAVGIKVTAVTSASGFILPGDRVDVILTKQFREPTKTGDARQKTISDTILCEIRILTIDQTLDDADKTKAKVGKTATLEVSLKQAEKLSTASTIGNLSLALRSLVDGAAAKAPGSDCHEASIEAPPSPVPDAPARKITVCNGPKCA